MGNVNIDTNVMGNSDIMSVSKVLACIAEKGINNVESIGWNNQSGNAYALLETGGFIVSAFGQDVSFLDEEENEIEYSALFFDKFVK